MIVLHYIVYAIIHSFVNPSPQNLRHTYWFVTSACVPNDVLMCVLMQTVPTNNLHNSLCCTVQRSWLLVFEFRTIKQNSYLRMCYYPWVCLGRVKQIFIWFSCLVLSVCLPVCLIGCLFARMYVSRCVSVYVRMYVSIVFCLDTLFRIWLWY